MRALLLGLCVCGCGTQFADPIRDAQGDTGAEAGASGAAGAPAVGDGSTCQEPVQAFDGTNFGTITRLIQDDFSIEVWVKTAQSLAGTGAYAGNPILFADVPTIVADDFGAGLLNDKFQMTVGNPDTPVRSTSNVTADRWVHLAATRTRASGIVLVFVDGVLEGIGTGNTNTLAASPSMTIGGRAERDFFTGQMSDLRIWSTVRTQAEILENMHRRLEGNEAGLVGYYRLDDLSGTQAKDTSPSQNHAVLDLPGTPMAADPPICGQ
ncbi:MAG TPA: LamG domain-containing protein [Polyangiaceae bacterium]|nr:LamG domain-containing protein [Polyangiaceae bacterium]